MGEQRLGARGHDDDRALAIRQQPRRDVVDRREAACRF